jgi:hypothetical protein
VSVTNVQEGLLSFFKRPLPERRKKPASSLAPKGEGGQWTAPRQSLGPTGQQGEKPSTAGEEDKEVPSAPASSAKDAVDDIKIR